MLAVGRDEVVEPVWVVGDTTPTSSGRSRVRSQVFSPDSGVYVLAFLSEDTLTPRLAHGELHILQVNEVGVPLDTGASTYGVTILVKVPVDVDAPRHPSLYPAQLLQSFTQFELGELFLTGQDRALVALTATLVPAAEGDAGADLEVVVEAYRALVCPRVVGSRQRVVPVLLVRVVPATADDAGAGDHTLAVMTTKCSLGHA
jgi:hypothetical protein